MEKNYNSLVIVGAQWGDEGKGKLTDYFAQSADYVVRFAGGDNAGHMIEFNNSRYKVTIVPSGIFNNKCINVIGNGTVINLKNLVKELNSLKDANINKNNLFISDRAHFIFDWHLKVDELQELSRKQRIIGTTKRGIGPTYADKISRYGVRVCDVFLDNFKDLMRANCDYHNQIIEKVYNEKPFDFEQVYQEFMKNWEVIKENVVDCGVLVSNAIENNKNVLFEGAQGVLLDIDHGTYPYVTSSNCSANNVAVGVGIHRKHISKVIGVVKAYQTRVGFGSMPTEIHGEIEHRIRERGREYGSNTKKPRRIGWLDIVALKYAIRVGGIDELFITLLDVLDTEKEVKLCVGYNCQNKKIDNFLASNEMLEKVEPIYETMSGWCEDITKVKSFDQLPVNCQKYLKRIEELTKTKIKGFSVGPDRKQTIII